MIDIKKLKEETGANIIVHADKKGNIIGSSNTMYANNFALMAEASFSMCNDLLKDIAGSDLKQLIAKSDKDYFIATKLEESNSILLIMSDNLTRFGLLLKYMNSIENK